MKPVNNFPSKAGASAEIVVGGHKQHPDPDQGMKFQTSNPLTHGPNINPRDYPYTMISGQCTQAALETSDPPPEPGSAVLKLPVLGAPSSHVAIGVLKDKNMGSASAGNMNNMGFPAIIEALNADVSKIASKGYKTTSEDGAEVRRENDGQNWKHNMTKGIPTHAAMYPLAGTILEARQNIDTAIQQFVGILNSSMLSQLPGQFMSIASALQSMSKKEKKQATKNMTADCAMAFESIAELQQCGDGGSSTLCGVRADPDTYKQNLIDLLSQCKDYTDVVACFQQMNNDDTLLGTDKLANTEITVTTCFGDVTQSMDCNGNVSIKKSDEVQKAIQAFSSMLNNAQQACSGGTNVNLFKDQANNMADMLGRIAPEVQKFRKELLEFVNTSSEAQKFKQILDKAAWQGGDPLSLIG